MPQPGGLRELSHGAASRTHLRRLLRTFLADLLAPIWCGPNARWSLVSQSWQIASMIFVQLSWSMMGWIPHSGFGKPTTMLLCHSAATCFVTLPLVHQSQRYGQPVFEVQQINPQAISPPTWLWVSSLPEASDVSSQRPAVLLFAPLFGSPVPLTFQRAITSA